jgi:hypothetical protein
VKLIFSSKVIWSTIDFAFSMAAVQAAAEGADEDEDEEDPSLFRFATGVASTPARAERRRAPLRSMVSKERLS